jgi:hypothetical protein
MARSERFIHEHEGRFIIARARRDGTYEAPMTKEAMENTGARAVQGSLEYLIGSPNIYIYRTREAALRRAEKLYGDEDDDAPRRGAGAPSEAYYRSLGLQSLKLRLPVDAIERLDAACDARGVSRTALVSEALDALLPPRAGEARSKCNAKCSDEWVTGNWYCSLPAGHGRDGTPHLFSEQRRR